MGLEYHYVDGEGKEVPLDDTLNPSHAVPSPDGDGTVKRLRTGEFFGLVLNDGTAAGFKKMNVNEAGTVSTVPIQEAAIPSEAFEALRGRLQAATSQNS